MRIKIQILSSREIVRDVLRKDGWMFETQDSDASLVRHPYVPDEQIARVRLQRLGLLTSGSLRIEFLGLTGEVHSSEVAADVKQADDKQTDVEQAPALTR